MSYAVRAAIAIAAMLPMVSLPPANAAEQVNIYSYRQPQLIEPLLKAFTAKTGIRANVIFAGAGLNERIVAEGSNSPADLLFTVDAGRLSEAKAAGITAAVTLPELAAIPAQFRDADGHWFGLTMRARIVYASKARVKQAAINYEELADPKWKGRICSRSGQHVYNTSLLATIIAHKGEAAAEAWARGLKSNLARKPAGGDREQVRDVHAGLCDLAIGNTYYMAVMQKTPAQKPWADSVKLLFPNTAGRGTHVNISGMALIKTAPHKAAALKLMAFLASAEAQRLYADENSEYPVDPRVAPNPAVQAWGKLVPDKLPLESIARYRKRASEIMDKVGFDAGPGS